MGWDGIGIGWGWIGWDWVGLGGMGLDGMGLDEMGWDGIGWDGYGIGWGRIGWGLELLVPNGGNPLRGYPGPTSQAQPGRHSKECPPTEQ